MNLNLPDIAFLLLVITLVWGWWRNGAVREQAILLAKQHCAKHNLQLLDDSVSRNRWKVTWQHGQPNIQRSYQFEFSSTGRSRYPGSITFVGNTLTDIWLSPHDI
ncbi:DUF3301 domain-containing protein [Marinomonas spartinae]|uniref:DUF3301 domain-containing protein n=1 Tax=Marinomonas spartinae TaxID=1792290 RepID=UPI0018F109AF|nr:DUF3301 domain-containing protein [Marinomonas spartinae]MBJ7554246.1 DUF3301 domain-containing protein [Marinomonas spartinae]